MTDFGDENINPFSEPNNEPALQASSPVEETPVAPPTPAKTAPSPYRGYPGQSPKTGFCCVRDEYLHSDNAEIQVSPFTACQALAHLPR